MQLKDWIDLAGAIGSVLVAILTGSLAVATFRLAKFTKATVADAERGLEQANRHHQENLRPFLCLRIQECPWGRAFGPLFSPKPPAQLSNGPQTAGRPYISIVGTLQNKGLGPAKNVAVYLNYGTSANGNACWLTHPVAVCGVVSAGELLSSMDIKIRDDRVATIVVDGQRRPTTTLDQAAPKAYEVVLSYQDIFGNYFRTVHAKGILQDVQVDIAVASGDRVLEAQQSTQPNALSPVFLEGKQPWRTLADLPRMAIIDPPYEEPQWISGG